MKFLFLVPPQKGLNRSEEYPPVGLGYLATALRNIGHEPDVQDCVINKWNIKNILDYIDISKPEIVGITMFSQSINNVREILKEIKTKYPKIISIIGGPHPTGISERVLKDLKNADYGVIGEGEIPLQQLAKYLEKGEGKLENIPGLIWREGTTIHSNLKIEHEKLEDFGFPAWDLINPCNYFSSPSVGPNTSVIHTSRGCPFLCQFCVKLGRKLRFRNLDHIYEEINMLHYKYGVNHFILCDEGFAMKPYFTKAFCQYVIDKGDNFYYSAGMGLRLNVLDDEMLELMKKANFKCHVNIGIESGVPRIRKLMKKSLTQQQIYRGIMLLNKHGFHPDGNFILGYPGETIREMQETIRVAMKLDLWGASFTPFLPLPGSSITNELMEQGKIPVDFDFSKLSQDSIIYASDGISIEEINSIRRNAVFKFNIRPRMLWYHIRGGRLSWAIIKALRIFLPFFLIPKKWRRVY